MVKHIVLFKLAEKTPANMNRAIEALKSLEHHIESLRYLEVGVDFKGSDRSYDLALTTHFDDRKGLEAYARHPRHLPVIEIMRSLCSSSIVVDFESPAA
ncbi:MAG: stress responsive protein [Nitrospinae bacterium CG11_big_fil_rev_8_21_14_0_20_56_8]|nr:MAG: stress responsive protein [Nitrospinae bacterium CG11_big_fil_rev_8_21_14_0_20_56_8]